MSAEVRRMFASIARRYDAANQVLSLGVHRGWRRAAVRLSGARAGEMVLDCATGTGDLAEEFRRAGARVTGSDFCLEMMQASRHRAPFVAADALQLPFHDGQFDVSSIAFRAFCTTSRK